MKTYQQTATALGSEAVLTIVGNKSDHESNNLLLTRLWRYIFIFEKNFSRFLHESELTQFNNRAGQWVAVSPDFEALLRSALSLSRQTEGLFNPFILPALQKAGYKDSWLSDDTVAAPDFSTNRTVSYEKLKIRPGKAKIPIRSALDLGGCGKGYLLDRLSEIVEAHGITNYCISLGGDIIARGNDPRGEAWKIGIADSNQPDKLAAYVQVAAGSKLAIATSGITKRRGTNWHHLIDTRSGKVAETDIMTATVTHVSGLSADVFASCLAMLGSANYQNFMNKQSLTEAFIQYDTTLVDLKESKHGLTVRKVV